jgi:ribosome-associated protein
LPDALTIALACAKAADAIQAEEIVVIDLRGLSSIADYFVVCTATSVPHLKAVSREIQHGVGEALGEKPRTSEGDASSLWLVIDYVDVIVHIFHSEKRYFYAIEDLWADAPQVPLQLGQMSSSDQNARGR